MTRWPNATLHVQEVTDSVERRAMQTKFPQGGRMPKYAKRRDDNEREIIDVLEAVGAQVHQLDQENKPDLAVDFRGEWIFLEVKGPNGKLTPGQKEFFNNVQAPAAVVRTIDEALQAIKVLGAR